MKFKKLRKDYFNRKKKFQKRLTVLLLKILRKNLTFMTYKNLSFFINNFYESRTIPVRDHCFLTGKNRGIISKYKLVRHEYKRLSNTGLLYGVCKRSF